MQQTLRRFSALAAFVLVMLCPRLVQSSDYDKLSYLTFSSAFQVPGATLPAGTYQVKLA